jgi:hypothetical protein
MCVICGSQQSKAQTALLASARAAEASFDLNATSAALVAFTPPLSAASAASLSVDSCVILLPVLLSTPFRPVSLDKTRALSAPCALMAASVLSNEACRLRSAASAALTFESGIRAKKMFFTL